MRVVLSLLLKKISRMGILTPKEPVISCALQKVSVSVVSSINHHPN